MAIGIESQSDTRVSHNGLDGFWVNGLNGKPSAASVSQRMKVERFARVVYCGQEIAFSSGLLLLIIFGFIDPYFPGDRGVTPKHVCHVELAAELECWLGSEPVGLLQKLQPAFGQVDRDELLRGVLVLGRSRGNLYEWVRLGGELTAGDGEASKFVRAKSGLDGHFVEDATFNWCDSENHFSVLSCGGQSLPFSRQEHSADQPTIGFGVGLANRLQRVRRQPASGYAVLREPFGGLNILPDGSLRSVHGRLLAFGPSSQVGNEPLERLGRDVGQRTPFTEVDHLIPAAAVFVNVVGTGAGGAHRIYPLFKMLGDRPASLDGNSLRGDVDYSADSFGGFVLPVVQDQLGGFLVAGSGRFADSLASVIGKFSVPLTSRTATFRPLKEASHSVHLYSSLASVCTLVSGEFGSTFESFWVHFFCILTLQK
jgi:hypothetical protein